MKRKMLNMLLLTLVCCHSLGQSSLLLQLPQNAIYEFSEVGDTSIIKAVNDNLSLIYLFKSNSNSPSRFILHNYANSVTSKSVNQLPNNVQLGLDSIRVLDMCIVGEKCYFCGYIRNTDNGYVSQGGVYVLGYKGIVGMCTINAIGCTISDLKYIEVPEVQDLRRIVYRRVDPDNAPVLSMIGSDAPRSYLVHLNLSTGQYALESPSDRNESFVDLVVNAGMIMTVSQFYVTNSLGGRSIDDRFFGLRYIKETEPYFYSSAFNTSRQVDKYYVGDIEVEGNNATHYYPQKGMRLVPYGSSQNELCFFVDQYYEYMILATIDMDAYSSHIRRMQQLTCNSQIIKDAFYIPATDQMAVLTKDFTNHFHGSHDALFVTPTSEWGVNDTSAHLQIFIDKDIHSAARLRDGYWMVSGTNSDGKIIEDIQSARMYYSLCNEWDNIIYKRLPNIEAVSLESPISSIGTRSTTWVSPRLNSRNCQKTTQCFESSPITPGIHEIEETE